MPDDRTWTKFRHNQPSFDAVAAERARKGEVVPRHRYTNGCVHLVLGAGAFILIFTILAGALTALVTQ